MRLGRDAIVFTKNIDSMSIAFLSQTFLEDVKANAVLVPLVTWDLAKSKHLSYSLTQRMPWRPKSSRRKFESHYEIFILSNRKRFIYYI